MIGGEANTNTNDEKAEARLALEKAIVDWSADRPGWQRRVMRNVANGISPNREQCNELVEELLAGKVSNDRDERFGLEDFQRTNNMEDPVQVLSIEAVEHVNALESEIPLSMEPAGLTIIYGRNGSGKSGYARLFKQVARCRHRDTILTDVFGAAGKQTPQATFKLRVGRDLKKTDKTVTWPTDISPELRRVSFYDQACGEAYIALENSFPYRPSALSVMDGLNATCQAMREYIDSKLTENTLLTQSIPKSTATTVASGIGRFLSKLSAHSAVATLDELITAQDASEAAIAKLKVQELVLGSSDTTKERQRLDLMGAKLDSIAAHIEAVHTKMSSTTRHRLTKTQAKIDTLTVAGQALTESLAHEPLSGVGSPDWVKLWEAARGYSGTHAYPDERFPVTKDGAKCVLCHQGFDESALARMIRFDKIIEDDIQKQLNENHKLLADEWTGLRMLDVLPTLIDTNLKDIEADDPDLSADVRAKLDSYETLRQRLVDAADSKKMLPNDEVTADDVTQRLIDASADAKARSLTLQDAAKVRTELATVASKRAELELLAECTKQRTQITQEIDRLKKRSALEELKSAAATTGITKTILELAETHITETVRNAFFDEVNSLRVEKVTLTKTRGDRNGLFHQPQLVGANQDVELQQVFSEGEKTALGLAAFFTEARLDTSKSAVVLDDPVNSLDHVRRAYVASRLALMAKERQVIVFTHDVQLVADLKREAGALGVTVGERSVQLGKKKVPGACDKGLPWKAKDVSGRLGSLRNDLKTLAKVEAEEAEETYAEAVGGWAGRLSETWESIISQEIIDKILTEGRTQVAPKMVKMLAKFSTVDDLEFQGSYARVSQWATRHNKDPATNYVPPDVKALSAELQLVESWVTRMREYRK